MRIGFRIDLCYWVIGTVFGEGWITFQLLIFGICFDWSGIEVGRR